MTTPLGLPDHAFLSAGYTLIVPELACNGRGLHDLISMVGDLRRRDIGLTSP